MNLALKFAAITGDTASSEMHIRRKYSWMLKGLFSRQAQRTPRDPVQDTANRPYQESSQPPARDETTHRAAADAPFNEGTVVDTSLTLGQDISILPSMEDYPFGPFLPEVMDILGVEGLGAGFEWPIEASGI